MTSRSVITSPGFGSLLLTTPGVDGSNLGVIAGNYDNNDAVIIIPFFKKFTVTWLVFCSPFWTVLTGMIALWRVSPGLILLESIKPNDWMQIEK